MTAFLAKLVKPLWFYRAVILKILNTKICDQMAFANSVDPDQTAPTGAVCSESTLIAIPLFQETISA